jgi:hypothetical protein
MIKKTREINLKIFSAEQNNKIYTATIRLMSSILKYRISKAKNVKIENCLDNEQSRKIIKNKIKNW